MVAATPSSAVDQRHGRDTQEFTWLVNLSDAVFAIAMTLLVLTLGYIALIARAHAVGAWTEPLPTPVFRRTITAFGLGAATLLVGVAVAFWLPSLALLVAVLQTVPMVVVLHRSPAAYQHWF